MLGMFTYVWRTVFPPRRRRVWPLLIGGIAAALGLGAAGGYAGPETPAPRLTPAYIDALHARAAHVGKLYTAASMYMDTSVRPLEHVLLQQRDDRGLARHVAVALVRESNRQHLSPRLLLGMLLVENPTVNPRARSPVGARGLMQVMPHHEGRWSCGGGLEDVDANICYGAHVFRDNLLDAGGDVEGALLRYNGCVRGTNTPDCRRYPQWVFSRASWARRLTQAQAAGR